MAENEQTEQQSEESEGVRNMRARIDELEGEAKRAKELERELAFTRAGIDTESRLGKMFANSYDGELTPEAIQADAREISPDLVAGTARTQPPVQATPEQQQETEELGRLAADAHTGEPPTEDLIARGHAEFRERAASGMPTEKAASVLTHNLIAAANAGDPKARWTGYSEEQLREGRMS